VSVSANRYPGFVRAARLVWLAMFAQRSREFTSAGVKRDLGISQRTLMRYVSILRDAGFVIDFHRSQRVWKIYCWDPDMAPVRGTDDTLRASLATPAEPIYSQNLL
jgi:predicted DNA-binding transcriptional regulator YafY